MSKQRRNALCECGSGRKFKHCHGKYAAAGDDWWPPQEGFDEIRRRLNSANADEYRRRLMFGLGNPIVSFESNGFRFVAIGMDIAWSKNWKTFADFLSEYLKGSLSPEWGKVELARPSLEMHPVIRWVHHIASVANKPMSVNPALRETAFDGTVRAYLGLAYDLFLCAHNVKMQALLIKRLRKKGTFAGALYEANVIGWFIRAGFKIDFEDESDVNSTHCEFTATHPLTGKKFSVEAKIIGDQSAYAGDSGLTPRIRHKLTEALRKKADYTRIVFIDLNRAENRFDNKPPAWEQALHEEIIQCEDVVVDELPAPPAYVFMTNRGYLHRLNDTSWTEFAIVDGYKIADFPIGKGCATILEMQRARERHIEMYWLTQALVSGNPVPMTFDGRSPEEAYAMSPLPPRIRIGDKLEFEHDGKPLSGPVVDALVNEQALEIVATVQVDAGYYFTRIPLSEVEMAIYRSSPDTFFDVVKPVQKPLTKPLEFFDFFAQSYSNTKKETLLEWMKDHSDLESLKATPQKELAQIYCDRMAASMWHRSQQPAEPQTVEKPKTEPAADLAERLEGAASVP